MTGRGGKVQGIGLSRLFWSEPLLVGPNGFVRLFPVNPLVGLAVRAETPLNPLHEEEGQAALSLSGVGAHGTLQA